MAKKGTRENPLSSVDMEKLAKAVSKKSDKDHEILKASLKDGYCNYLYRIIEGKSTGEKHDVKGAGIYREDLEEAFRIFNVHFACLDDVFKHAGKEITDIDMHHNDELTALYRVTSFEIKGVKESESIVLSGTKFVSTASGYCNLTLPAVHIDKLSNYKWWNELKAAADDARNEVSRYKEGHYDAPVEEEKPTKKQGNLFNADAAAEGETEIDDDTFEKGKQE